MVEMKINEKNLCVFASNPPFDKEGFLNKRGEVNKAFQRRYFVLKGNLLFYFEKKGDKEPLGLIIVEGCTIELSEESAQYCFEIAFNGNRTYVLSADSQEGMESWMKALTCAGYEYKRLIVCELQRKLDELEGSKNRNVDSSVPKPPPRRQNPFNRPAPPPPSQAPNEKKCLRFIEAHYGYCHPTTSELFHFEERVNNSNVNVKLMPSCASNSANASTSSKHVRSEFYVQSIPTQKDASSYKMIKTATESMFSAECHKSIIKVNDMCNFEENFEERHESLRPLIMKDVLAYRAARHYESHPLIDL